MPIRDIVLDDRVVVKARAVALRGKTCVIEDVECIELVLQTGPPLNIGKKGPVAFGARHAGRVTQVTDGRVPGL
jgi:hypothetical protein